MVCVSGSRRSIKSRKRALVNLISKFRNYILQLGEVPFVRNVAILTGGTAFAQGLMAVSLPLLTRIYKPEDFGILSVYMAVLGIVSVLSCLRFDIAIPLPEHDHDAINVLALAILASSFVASLIAILVVVWPQDILALLRQPGMATYLWMIPLGVWLVAIYSSLQYWASRKRRFQLITHTRISRAIGGAGSQLLIGLFSATPFGLLFGRLLYGGVGVPALLRSIWQNDRHALRAVSIEGMRRNAKNYRRFPTYSVPESFFTVLGEQLPLIVIAAMASSSEAGFVMLAMSVMGLPMGLVGSSVAQVYLTEAPAKLREGSLAEFTVRTMWAMLKAGGGPILIVGIFSPLAFPILFGDEWVRAGVIVAWMTPWFILQFVASPISVVLHVTGNLRLAMLMQALGCILRIGFVLYAFQWDAAYVAEMYAVSSAIFYAIYILVITSVIRVEKPKQNAGLL